MSHPRLFRFLAVFLSLWLLTCGALADTLYKSVTPDGRIVYSDQPPTGGKLEKTLKYESMPATPLPESVLRYREELLKSLKARQADLQKPTGKAQLFVAAWCGYCRKAKAYLTEKKIPFLEYDIDTPDGKLAFAQANSGTGIPLLLWQGKKIHGFKKEGYDALFAQGK